MYFNVTKFSGTLNLAILTVLVLSLNLVDAKPVKCMADSLYRLKKLTELLKVNKH